MFLLFLDNHPHQNGMPMMIPKLYVLRHPNDRVVCDLHLSHPNDYKLVIRYVERNSEKLLKLLTKNVTISGVAYLELSIL